VVEKAAKLNREAFGVAVGQGRRGSGGWGRSGEAPSKPLAFGQFGEMAWGGPGLEALLAPCSLLAR
jgi:hypothetical protein